MATAELATTNAVQMTLCIETREALPKNRNDKKFKTRRHIKKNLEEILFHSELPVIHFLREGSLFQVTFPEISFPTFVKVLGQIQQLAPEILLALMSGEATHEKKRCRNALNLQTIGGGIRLTVEDAELAKKFQGVEGVTLHYSPGKHYEIEIPAPQQEIAAIPFGEPDRPEWDRQGESYQRLEKAAQFLSDLVLRGQATLEHGLTETAVSELATQWRTWKQAYGIQAFGVGPQETEPELEGPLVLVIGVEEEDLDREDNLPEEQRLPEKITIPELGEFDYIFEELPALEAAQSYQEVQVPAFGGCSIGPETASEERGTLGCLIKVRNRSGKHILTAAHVLLSGNPSHKNLEEVKILQPAQGDKGDLQNPLALGFEDTILLKNGEFHPVDAGFFKVHTKKGRTVSAAISDEPAEVYPTGWAKWQFGDEVKLCGATSNQWVEGHIIRKFSAVFLDNPKGGLGRFAVKNLVICDLPAQKGDSGAAVLDEEDRVLGILVAVDEEDGFSAFCPIEEIVGAFPDIEGLILEEQEEEQEEQEEEQED